MGLNIAYVPAVTDEYLPKLRPAVRINDVDTPHGIYETP